METYHRITIIVLAALLLALPALADHVTFDNELLGTTYGGAPGDYMFSEYGADLYVDNFYSAGAPYFNYAQIDPASAVFGNNQILEVNNVGVRFNFSSAGTVTFEYLDMGGSVNIQVNGFGAVLEGADFSSLIGAVAPGVTMNASVVPVSGGHMGLVTLTGPVTTMQVGGQELWIEAVRCDNGYVAGPAACDYEVNHQTQPVGNAWGTGFGHAPGDLMFVQDGIPVSIGEIDWGTGTGFNFCDIQVPGIPGFGFDRVMNINNVSNNYKISALGIAVQQVSFEFVDYGGMENLQVNGAVLHIGDLPTFPAAVAPGVTLNVATWPIPGGVRGEVVLTGDVQQLLVAGQEFMVDNLCVAELAPAGGCDLVSDNESQLPGAQWGSAWGDSPGDFIFNEDGIDVGVEAFDAISIVLFNEATTNLPWGPLGNGNVLHLNNICATYDLAPIGPTATVTFDWVKGGGMENLGINGVLYVGAIEAIPAGFFPGVAVNIPVNSGPGYTYGKVTINGDVQHLQIGGQEFYVDDVCVHLEGSSEVPEVATGLIELHPNFPNPFNPSTTMRYSLVRAGHVRLSIMDVAGRHLALLVDEQREAGDHQLVWSGKDDQGRQVASGMYFVQLESAGQIAIRKVALLK